MIRKRWITDQQAEATINLINVTSDPAEAAASADLLSESVYESIEVKRAVLKTFAELVPPALYSNDQHLCNPTLSN